MKYSQNTDSNYTKIGLLIPFHGPIGFWGLSSESCAQLAASELNSYKGILGKEIELVPIDASGAPSCVASNTSQLVEELNIEALIGMHTSDIRVAVIEQLKSKIPFVYTPMYEGGESNLGVFMVGETPESLITTMITWLSKNINAKKWYLIGNDYLWPRTTNGIAKSMLREQNKTLLAEDYVPFHLEDFTSQLDSIEKAQPDIVFVSLIGQSSVLFNRQFGERGLSDKIIRYCCAIEENSLCGIGSENTKNLYSTMSYHQNLNTASAQSFSKYYNDSFGQNAPEINQFATSCYDGVNLLANLAEKAGEIDCYKFERAAEQGMDICGPRGQLEMKNKHIISNLNIVKADGIAFKTI